MADRGDRAADFAGESSGADLDADERLALDRLAGQLGDDSLWESPPPEGQFRLLAAASAEATERAKEQSDNAAWTAPDPIRPVDPTPAVPPRIGRAMRREGDDNLTDRARPLSDRARPLSEGDGFSELTGLAPDGVDDDDGDDDVLALLERRRVGRQRAAWFGAGALITAAAAIVALAVTGRLGDRDGDGNGVDQTEVAATYELAATELDPDAVTSVDVKPTVAGVEFELTLVGLDNTDGESYYAAWLVGDDGEAVPLGSFHWRAGGVPIILGSGVDDPTYSRLMVTRQVQGDGGARSDQVVLMGVVPDLTADG